MQSGGLLIPSNTVNFIITSTIDNKYAVDRKNFAAVEKFSRYGTLLISFDWV